MIKCFLIEVIIKAAKPYCFDKNKQVKLVRCEYFNCNIYHYTDAWPSKEVVVNCDLSICLPYFRFLN